MTDWNVFEHGEKSDPLIKVTWAAHSMLDSNDVHIVPVDDKIEHGLSPHCPCGPDESSLYHPGFSGYEVGEATKWTHKAWDGRAPLEQEMKEFKHDK